IAVKHFSNDSFEAKESYGNYSKIKTTNWSLVQGLYLNKSRLYSSKTLVPDQYNASFSQLEGLKALETSTLGIEAGVTGLYSFYNFHISGMLAIGWHVQKQEYSGIHSDDRTVSDSAVSSLVELGHNGLSGASFGVQVRNQAINIPIKNASYALERSTFSLYYKYFF
ncbi:MAG: hypothetical protein HON90_14950, partial [Halobacteriovoraceae bacterium]|nr:hypothetical protein [Halobacteriovoraceae bacterium]